MNPVVSVVLPIYNVEKYLDRCVESVLGQTYQNLEILLVDDGATDSSPQKCDQWALKDSRIKVIHKKNAGLGMARNTGIEYATGAYICFFDSDDYIAPDTVELALNLAQKEQAEVVIFGMSLVDKQGNVTRTVVPETKKVCYRDHEVVEQFLPNALQPDLPDQQIRNLSLSAWRCLISTRLIEQRSWRFVSEREIISEDIYSLLDLLGDARSVAVLEKALYYYCANDASLTRSYRSDRFARNKHFYCECIELCKKRGYPASVEKACISPFLGNTIAAMKQEIVHHKQRKAAVRSLKEIIDDPVLSAAVTAKKQDACKLPVRMLLDSMRHRLYGVCYWLLCLKLPKKD